ncbi:MAG: FAD-dependent oxidoreductase [Planctomycetota bacterium]
MRMTLVMSVLAVALCATVRAREVVWAEAERFAERGGWTVDAQFIDQMGSPYLMAIGLGEPVEDAATTVTVPAAGRWRLWARTRDWVPEHSPGRFRVVVNGAPAAKVFGASGKKGWRWEDGGVVELTQDEVKLRLRDLTGYYARCDAVVMTDDLDWTPPAAVEAIAELREKHGGVSRQVKTVGEYDVVVVGGGLAGCTAAVAAARNGARVALIQNRPVLGGNASTEILVPPVGVWPHGGMHRVEDLDPRETGLVEEYRTPGNQRVSEGQYYSQRLRRFVTAEPDVDLHLNTHATGVEMKAKDTIAAVRAVHVHQGQRLRFPARLIIDCTGDAVVGVAAGAEYRHGKEPKSMYDEPWAPEKPSKHTMGNGLKYYVRDTGEPVAFQAPPWAMEFPNCSDFRRGRHPRIPKGVNIGYQWVIELGGLRDTYADAEEIRDDLLKLIYGLWDHTKNHCPKLRKQAATLELAWVSYVAGKRENRRIMGDHVLTQNDILDQTLFRDRVAYGGWSMDDHHSEGFFSKGHPVRIPLHGWNKGKPYSIPYRSLYSKNVTNLMMAGRDLSASHLGLSNARVMLTCAVMGHAAGTAAGLCIQRQTTPRGVYERYLEPLQQQLLKEGAHIIDLPNRDPRDLARQARAAASSQRSPAAGALDGYARAARDDTHAWEPKTDDEAPWLELAWDEPQELNVVHVTFLTRRHAPARFALAAWQDGAWKTLAEVDTARFRRHVVGLDRVSTSRLRVSLDGGRGRMGINEVRVYDEPQEVVERARRVARTLRLPDHPPKLPFGPGIRAIKLPGIVLDHHQAQQTGPWVHSTFTEPYVGDGYIHDGNEAKGDKRVVFVPEIPKAGRYDVRIAYVPYPNRATNVPVTVQTPAAARTVRIDQRKKPPIDGLFLSLGVFDLPAGRKTRIVVANAGTDGYVIADAVQLLPR